MVNESELEPVRLLTRLIAMCHECRSSVFARLAATLATGTRHDRQMLKTELDWVAASSPHEACGTPETGDTERRLRAVADHPDGDPS